MLRMLFDEPMRQNAGDFKTCIDQIEQFCLTLRNGTYRNSAFPRFYRLELTARGFIQAYNELEQSMYCSKRLAEGLRAGSMEQMSSEELTQYYRYLYFYKNSFIRIFSILDKLGYFMNDLFRAKTERVKTRFSYYTVLRHMRKRNIHPVLNRQLHQYKGQYQEAMQQLRKKRNLEIHSVNVEIIDELVLKEKEWLEHHHIENIRSNLAELEQGYQMVTRSMLLIFQYANKLMKKRN